MSLLVVVFNKIRFFVILCGHQTVGYQQRHLYNDFFFSFEWDLKRNFYRNAHFLSFYLFIFFVCLFFCASPFVVSFYYCFTVNLISIFLLCLFVCLSVLIWSLFFPFYCDPKYYIVLFRSFTVFLILSSHYCMSFLFFSFSRFRSSFYVLTSRKL